MSEHTEAIVARIMTIRNAMIPDDPAKALVRREIEALAPSRSSPETETLPEWEDADVQLVYKMLCDPELNNPPNPEEHWEGWISRNIVRALRKVQTSPVSGLLPCPFCGGAPHHHETWVWCSGTCDIGMGFNDWNTRKSGHAQSPDWQPIETAPKDGTFILVFSPGRIQETVAWCKDREFWMNGFDDRPVEKITHWMPLPQSPDTSTDRTSK
jgi:hypothetical protein